MAYYNAFRGKNTEKRGNTCIRKIIERDKIELERPSNHLQERSVEERMIECIQCTFRYNHECDLLALLGYMF